MSFARYLRNLLSQNLFSNKGIPEWVGGMLLGVINVFFLAWALKPFSIYSGFLNWGQHIYSLLGLSGVIGSPKNNPLFDKTSVGDLGLMIGAFTAALLSHELKLRKPASIGDVIDGFLGGTLMALGVVLASGCNWGGYFSAITVLSLHGFLMAIGLYIGGWLGSLYVRWRVERAIRLAELKSPVLSSSNLSPSSRKTGISLAPMGLPIVIAVLILSLGYYVSVGAVLYAGIMFFGLTVGMVLQRSRFCFASAFRDVLGGPEFRRSIALQKGIIIAMLIGVTGSFILKYLGYIDPMVYVKPSHISNVIGGVIFGLGMVIAGGCASGSLWKAAEGHIKLWISLLAAVLSYPVLKTVIHAYAPWIFGPKLFIPDLFGWGTGLALTYVLLSINLLAILYLEYRHTSRGGGNVG